MNYVSFAEQSCYEQHHKMEMTGKDLDIARKALATVMMSHTGTDEFKEELRTYVKLNSIWMDLEDRFGFWEAGDDDDDWGEEDNKNDVE